MSHLTHFNQTNAFIFFSSIYKILNFSSLICIQTTSQTLQPNPEQNFLSSDLSISLKPSGLQEHGHTALFPRSLTVFYELSVWRESGALQHLINMTAYWAALGCTLGTGRKSCYRGIDPSFFSDPFWSLFFCDLSTWVWMPVVLKSWQTCCLSGAPVEVYLFQPRYCKI